MARRRPLVINSSCFQTALKLKFTEIHVIGTSGVTVLPLETMCISCGCPPSKQPFASKVEHKYVMAQDLFTPTALINQLQSSTA